jgi:two-component system nitrogen regulation response regulator NtrX
VLVIDDERGVRESLRFLLDAHFKVEVVASGEAALTLLQDRKFDVVVLDLAMPGMSGLETLVKIREVDREVEVVITTGYGSKQSAAEIARLRAFGLVTKPFDSARILSMVRGAANARHEA